MTEFHVVRSVKGGSGKTTFALHTLVKLVTESKDDNKKILYIDADVHASETRNMLLEYMPQAYNSDINYSSEICFFQFYSDQYICSNPEKAENQKCKLQSHTLNSFMHPYKGYVSKVSQLAIPGKLQQLKGSIIDKADSPETPDYMSEKPSSLKYLGKAFFIFADPSPSGRKVFGSLYQSYGKSAIGVGAYIAKMKSLFNYILEDKYDDVVIDMPPGSDTFSEHLMDCLLGFVDDKKREESDKCKISIYYISTRDQAHLRTATEAAIENLHAMRLRAADRICFVFNHGVKDEPTIDRKELISLIDDSFKNNKDYPRDRLQFELMRLSYHELMYDAAYYKSSINKSILFISSPSTSMNDL